MYVQNALCLEYLSMYCTYAHTYIVRIIINIFNKNKRTSRDVKTQKEYEQRWQRQIQKEKVGGLK